MSTKDLFDKGHSLNFLKNKALTDYREDVESPRYVDAYVKRRNRFFPDVNYATASNFAAYGLAEEYYRTSIERIYKTYPYDGSLAEKIEWENDSSYLDLFIFENEYPRSNGYVVFNSSSYSYTDTKQGNVYSSSAPQYISFYGNLHADPGGNYKSLPQAGPASSSTSKANIYETGSYRTANLEIDLEKGITVEFWLKKTSWASENAAVEVLFSNITNGTGADTLLWIHANNTDKSKITIELITTPDVATFEHSTGLTNIADGNWHHYSFTVKKSGTTNVGNLYVDGVHKSKLSSGAAGSFTNVTAPTVAALGAMSKNTTIFMTLDTETASGLHLTNLDIGKQKELHNKLEDILEIRLAAVRIRII